MTRLLITDNKVINLETLVNNFKGTYYGINYLIHENSFRIEYNGFVLFFTYDQVYYMLTTYGYECGVAILKRRVLNEYKKCNY
jgi:hypothetical protein